LPATLPKINRFVDKIKICPRRYWRATVQNHKFMLMHPIKTSVAKIFMIPTCRFYSEFSAVRLSACQGQPQ